jgi:hypothetical protein
MVALWEHLQHQGPKLIREQVVVGNLLLEVINSRENLILQLKVVVLDHMLGTPSTLSTISAISKIGHHKVLLMIVGVMFSSLVHLECRGLSTESVSHSDNADTSCPIALNGNHNS